MMSKIQAKALFGGTDAGLAGALGIGRTVVTRMPAWLSRRDEDRVVGAAIRLQRWPHGYIPSDDAKDAYAEMMDRVRRRAQKKGSR